MLRSDKLDIYNELVAGRHTEAVYLADRDRVSLPADARESLREGRWQDAICRIERDLFPRRPWFVSRIGKQPHDYH